MIKRKQEVYTIIEPEIQKLRNVGIETANLDCRLLLSISLKSDKTLYKKLCEHDTEITTMSELNKYQRKYFEIR